MPSKNTPANVHKDPFLAAAIEEAEKAMCSVNNILYGIPRVVIAENFNFQGEEAWLESRGVELELVQHVGCIEMMQTFIKENDTLWDEDIGES